MIIIIRSCVRIFTESDMLFLFGFLIPNAPNVKILTCILLQVGKGYTHFKYDNDITYELFKQNKIAKLRRR